MLLKTNAVRSIYGGPTSGSISKAVTSVAARRIRPGSVTGCVMDAFFVLTAKKVIRKRHIRKRGNRVEPHDFEFYMYLNRPTLYGLMIEIV